MSRGFPSGDVLDTLAGILQKLLVKRLRNIKGAEYIILPLGPSLSLAYSLSDISSSLELAALLARNLVRSELLANNSASSWLITPRKLLSIR